MKHPAICVFVVLLLAGTGLADIVYLKSGGSITGKATRSGPEVVVETLGGKTRVRADRVTEIDFDHEAAIEVYLGRREEAEKAGTAEAYLELAAWAVENKATKYAVENVADARAVLGAVDDTAAVLALADRFEKALESRMGPIWERILELSPDNERARRALGYHRIGDGWGTEEEFQLAQGKVEFEGAWMTPAERDQILRERKEKFDEREKDLSAAERDFTHRLKLFERDLEHVERVKEELEDRYRELNRQLRELEEREDDVRRRERLIGQLYICRSCRARYSGTHICPNEWILCRTCGGRFPRGHRCR